MLKKSCMFLSLLFLVTTAAKAETFDEIDTLGQWHVYELDVDSTIGAYWHYADIDVAGATDISGEITTPFGSTMEIISGESSIASNGFLSGSFTTDTGLNGTIVDGLQDQNHSIFSYVSADSQDTLGLAIGIKSGGQYQASDMAGEWRFYGIDVDPTLPGLYWIIGDVIVDAAGSISSGDYSGPDGTTINLTDGQLAVAPDGTFTGAFDFESGLKTQVVNGTVDGLKTFAAFVYSNSKNGLGFDIALKKGGAYRPADLTGDWTFYNFTIDAANELAYWLFGNGTIDSEGHLAGSYAGPDGSFFTISSGQASIDNSGELSGSFTIDGGATETIQSGFMDRNKSMIVYVGASDNNQMDLGIGFRTSDPPALETSRASSGQSDGGGGGGCFIDNMMD
jgi:hypothetical protein